MSQMFLTTRFLAGKLLPSPAGSNRRW
jgi:hypothetical protein